jgi:hypothetical protein
VQHQRLLTKMMVARRAPAHFHPQRITHTKQDQV